MNLRNALLLVAGMILGGFLVGNWMSSDAVRAHAIGYNEGSRAGEAAAYRELNIGQPGPPGPTGAGAIIECQVTP